MKKAKPLFYAIEIIGIVFLVVCLLQRKNQLLLNIKEDPSTLETAVNFQLTEEKDYFSTLKKGNNMLLFWGSACPHCEAVFATLRMPKNSWIKERLFTISLDENIESIKESAKEYPIYLDFDLAVSNSYKVDSIPAVIIISDEGKIVDRAKGEREVIKRINVFSK